MNYYKVPIEEGKFKGVDYNDVVEGVAFDSNVKQGCGYFASETEYPNLEKVTEEEFWLEKGGTTDGVFTG